MAEFGGVTMADKITDMDEDELEFDDEEYEEDLELNDEQLERNDDIYNAALDFCKVLTENPELEWDMAFIGEIADFAANCLTENGYKVRFPSVVTDDDDSQYIAEYYGE